MRRDGRAAEQSNGILSIRQELLHEGFLPLGETTRVRKDYGTQTAVFNAERVELRMAPKENDGDRSATRPIQYPTYAARSTGKTCGIEHNEIDERSRALEQGFEYLARGRGIETQDPRS